MYYVKQSMLEFKGSMVGFYFHAVPSMQNLCVEDSEVSLKVFIAKCNHLTHSPLDHIKMWSDAIILD